MRDKRVYKMVVCALFTALCFVGTMIQIPLPSGGMTHLGNFFCVLCALLCGGVVGGFAGGVGCGLYDLIIYSSPTGMVKYFILKFIMGFFVGSVFRLIINKNKKINYTIWLSAIASAILLAVILVMVGYNMGHISLSKSIKNPDMYMIIIYVIGALFAIGLVVAAVLTKKINKLQKGVLFVVSISVIINIVLEFLAKLIMSLTIDALDINASLVKAFSSMPACILTGGVTCAIIVLMYPHVYNATKNINYLNDIKVDGNEEV